MRRVVATLTSLVMSVAGVGLAATTSRLSGTVVDDQGSPLPGVTVQLSSEALIGGPQTAISDGNGAFVFHLLPVGIYSVEATLAGLPGLASLAAYGWWLDAESKRDADE